MTIQRVSSEDAEPPIEKYLVTPAAKGEFRFFANSPDAGLAAESNTLCVHAERPQWQLIWGDLHSGQTEISCGAGSLAEHYSFGRDCASLQFITHQANDHYVTLEDWEHTRRTTEEFYQPGRYVTLLGCEWSPLTKDGGDRNIIYFEDEPRL